MKYTTPEGQKPAPMIIEISRVQIFKDYVQEWTESVKANPKAHLVWMLLGVAVGGSFTWLLFG